MATAVAKPVRFVWLRWLGVLPTMFLVFCLGNVIAAPWGPLIRLFGALLTGALMVYLPCRLIPKYRMWAGGFLMALMPLLLLMSALITHPHPEHPISHWIGLGLGLLLYEGGGAFGLAMIADEAKKNASAS
jgi:MFS family permease